MRLWHQDLIPLLPSVKDYKGCSNQLGGQHTEIRMILGTINKHGKVNHSTVNYINHYPIYYLHTYGLLVIDDMIKREFNVSQSIIDEYTYRESLVLYNTVIKNPYNIYSEHNDSYMQECISNLRGKNVIIRLA